MNHPVRFFILLCGRSHSARLERFPEVTSSCKLFDDNEQQQWLVRTVFSPSIWKQQTVVKPSCSIKMPELLSLQQKIIYLFSSIPNIGLLTEHFEWVINSEVFISNYLSCRSVRTTSINYLHVNHTDSPTSQSSMVSLVVNDRLCSFELDTGASATIIGHHDWCKLGKPSLQSSKLLQINSIFGNRMVLLLREAAKCLRWENKKA